MIKRTPSRNARSRGFKLKHVLQIFLLLGVCFWLIYQVKHSHDKKKELDEKEAKISIRNDRDYGRVDFGRKGLLPRVQETNKDEKHEEDDDEETATEDEVMKIEQNKLEQKQVEDEIKRDEEERQEGTKHEDEEEEREDGSKVEGGAKDDDEEEEERGGEKKREEEDQEEEEEEETKHEEDESGGNKHEDEEQEEETHIEEIEEEGRGGGDDEIDERDQEKIEGGADRVEDFVAEEKDGEEEGDEKKTKNDVGEDKEAQVDHEDQDHAGGVQSDHEAREVNYRADDASSAVTHDAQVVSTDPEKGNLENSNENSVSNDLELENNSTINNDENMNRHQSNSELQLKASEDPSLRAINGENKGNKVINSEVQLPGNVTLNSVYNNQTEGSNKLVDVNAEAGNNPVNGDNDTSAASQKNETIATSDSYQPQNTTVGSNGEASYVKTTELDQANNSTAADRTGDNETIVHDPKADSELTDSSMTIRPEVTAGAGVNNGSTLTVDETKVASRDDNTKIKNESGGTDGTTSSSRTDESGSVHDPIDSSDSSNVQDDTVARIDLDTLAENSSEDINSHNVAEE